MNLQGKRRWAGGSAGYSAVAVGLVLALALAGGLGSRALGAGNAKSVATIHPSVAAASSAGHSKAVAPLTRGGVIKIVRREVRREFALRDWHHYAGYIDEYTAADSATLFSLSGLDRATAAGSTNAPMRVIEYADYECPYCKSFEAETAPALRSRFRSRALFVYRFYPLEIHGKVAQAEAVAGACVARIAGPDAFGRFTRTLFARTGSNGLGTSEPVAELATAALRTGQSKRTGDELAQYYGKCTKGKIGAALVTSDEAFKGVTGTPTIFVVDVARHRAWRLAGSLPSWVFEMLIANVIAGKPGNSDWAVEQDNEASWISTE